MMGAFSGDLRLEHFWGQIDNLRISYRALAAKDLLMKAAEAKQMNPPTNFFADKQSKNLLFAYSGEKSPNSWGQLVKTWGTCSTGEKQSPVNLPSPLPDETTAGAGKPAIPASHLKYIEMAYHTTTATTYFNGTQYGFTLGPKAGLLLLNDEKFRAERVLFHTPSEHTIGGMPAEMEMQMEHVEKTSGKKVMVSILFQKGRINHTLKPVLDKMGKANMVGGKFVAPTPSKLGSFDLLDIIPFDPGFIIYDGSLTIPPCTEGVRWIIIDKVITASAEQIDIIKRIVGDNARPQKPLDGRIVKRVTSGTSLLSSLLRRQEVSQFSQEEVMQLM